MRFRLIRYGAVGILATAVHGLCLLLLTSAAALGGGVANFTSFVIAFTVSIQAQQRFTFNDRLGDQQLNTLAVLLLFLINAILAATLGSIAVGIWRVLLPLVPAMVNYILLYVATGLQMFLD
jgi:putative flippase GtrA